MSTFSKRLIAVLVALVLLSYVGYQCFTVFYSAVELETAVSRSVYDTLDVQGVAIRSEQVLTQSVDGYIYYTVTNGDRVAKDGTIASVYKTEADALAEQQYQQLTEEMTALQTLQKQGNASKSSLDSVNRQIRQVQQQIVTYTQAGNLEGAAGCRTDLAELLNRQQLIVGKTTDFSPRINELSTQRDQLQGTFQKAVSSIQSPVAGYFVSKVDGYEDRLSYDTALDLTVQDVQNALAAEPAPTGSQYIGKVVGDYEWYLACVVPSERLAALGEGTTLSVRLPFVAEETVPVTVEKINKDTDSAVVLLKCSYMSEALSSVRCEQVQILLEEYTGLYVPDSAMRFNDDKEPGVLIRRGNALQFRRVRVLYYNDIGKYSICDPEGGEGYLKLYDDMVIGGKNVYDGKIVG